MRLEAPIGENKEVEQARALILKCVHCGFCNATCPTYQETGDELDGPRGRIYLIKSLLEEKADGKETQFHLDRCLTCRNCETTCPSGVEYGQLVNLGRHVAEQKQPRNAFDLGKRKLLVAGLSKNQPLQALVAIAQSLRPILPKKVKAQLPRPLASVPLTIDADNAERRFILLDGCAQRHLAPQINEATQTVLAALNIATVRVPSVQCCGALHLHTTGEEDGIKATKDAIDGFIAALDSGASGLVMTASGCGVHVKDYPKLFEKTDPYFEKAKRVADSTFDIVELVANELNNNNTITLAPKYSSLRIAVHEPCTLQHGQKLQGKLTALLSKLNATTVPFGESHMCCGSAGSYSVLQPQLATALRHRKLNNIVASDIDLIVSANIGCILHLAGAVPIRHWVEILAESVSPSR